MDIPNLKAWARQARTDISRLINDLADANAKLSRVREDVIAFEHERGCAAAWYHRRVRASNGMAGKTRMLYRGYIVHDDCDCARGRALAILDGPDQDLR